MYDMTLNIANFRTIDNRVLSEHEYARVRELKTMLGGVFGMMVWELLSLL